MKPKGLVTGGTTFWWSYEDGIEPGGTYPRHTHKMWELLLVTEGSMRVWTDGRESRGVVGSIFVRSPGTPHQEWCTSKVRLRLLILFWLQTPRFKLTLPTETFDSGGYVRQAILCLQRLYSLLPSKHPVLNYGVEGVIHECRNTADTITHDPFPSRVADIQKKLGEPYTLDLLGEKFSMSRTQLTREFRRHFGMSPMAYVRKARLEQACRLISTTDKVLYQIALDSGFRDESELSRVFRRVMGVAPGSLRKKVAAD